MDNQKMLFIEDVHDYLVKRPEIHSDGAYDILIMTPTGVPEENFSPMEEIQDREGFKGRVITAEYGLPSCLDSLFGQEPGTALIYLDFPQKGEENDWEKDTMLTAGLISGINDITAYDFLGNHDSSKLYAELMLKEELANEISEKYGLELDLQEEDLFTRLKNPSNLKDLDKLIDGTTEYLVISCSPAFRKKVESTAARISAVL